jgi:hypothetical protein
MDGRPDRRPTIMTLEKDTQPFRRDWRARGPRSKRTSERKTTVVNVIRAMATFTCLALGFSALGDWERVKAFAIVTDLDDEPRGHTAGGATYLEGVRTCSGEFFQSRRGDETGSE